jgi:hypothetical protein
VQFSFTSSCIHLFPVSYFLLHSYVGMLILFFQEYLDDGIDWASVEFVDNTDCLSLFEKVYCIYFSRACFTYGP